MASHIPVNEMLIYAGFTSPVKDIQNIAAGMLNDVYKISLHGEKDIVLRVRKFQHAEYGQEFAAERLAYNLIQSKDVRIPQLHFVNLDRSIYGYPFAIFEHVTGTTLDLALDDKSLPKSQRYKILANLGYALAQIHQVKAPGYGTLTEKWFEPHEDRAFWQKLFGKERVRLQDYYTDIVPDYDIATQQWLDTLSLLPSYLKGPQLVHGDIHGRNVIIQNCDVIPIDWEASRYRIAPYDFAQLRYLNLRNDPDGWGVLIDNYIQAVDPAMDSNLFQEAIQISQAFWQLRMGLFFKQFPFGESPYFGTAEEHIESAFQFIKKTTHNSGGKAMTTKPEHINGLAEVCDQYDAFIIDQWGVIHDGNELYSGVREALQKLQDIGKTVIILTNSSKTNEANSYRLFSKFGIGNDLYNHIISSAHILRDLLINKPYEPWNNIGNNLFIVAADQDADLIKGTILKSELDIRKADAILLLSITPGEDKADHQEWINTAIQRGLKLVCPSADLLSVSKNGIVPGMASVVNDYKSKGGVVINIGKPEKPVYDLCKDILKNVKSERVLAIGDQIASDCLGANQNGFDSALVCTGATLDAFNNVQTSTDVISAIVREENKLQSPKWVLPSLRWKIESSNQNPFERYKRR